MEHRSLAGHSDLTSEHECMNSTVHVRNHYVTQQVTQLPGLTCVLVCAQEHGRDDFGRIPGCPGPIEIQQSRVRRQNPNQV